MKTKTKRIIAFAISMQIFAICVGALTQLNTQLRVASSLEEYESTVTTFWGAWLLVTGIAIFGYVILYVVKRVLDWSGID
jgi:hypothetical protein